MNIKYIVPFLCAVIFATAHQRINFGFSTHQNKRPYQEDRFTHVHIHEGDFFGIYDGHGGDNVSSFLQNNLHNYLVGPFFTMKQACKHAFAKAETYALQHYTDGSTALMTFIDHNNILHCAWTGDTRAVLEKNGCVAFETTDHKPDNEKELARIKKHGGYVTKSSTAVSYEALAKYEVYRVGGLAISRSIGDVNIKNACKDQVIAVPEYAKITLNKSNHFMIMASDGLWDVMSSDEAVRMVSAMIKTMNITNIAQFLQNEAIQRGSGDNITVCVVQFNE